MRTHGPAGSAAGLGADGHVCWLYDDESSFRRAAVRFLGDGLALNQRLMFVTSWDRDRMLAELADLAEVERLVERGVLELVDVRTVYDTAAPLVPEQQLAHYAAMADQAVADDFTGLRVVAEVTALVVDGDRCAAHVRWEHLADQFMVAHRTLAALSGYDRRVLADADCLADIATVHPVVYGAADLAPFHLFFDGDRLVVTGEVDSFGSTRLDRLLAISPVVGDPVVLDLTELRFADARALHTLVRFGARLNRSGRRLQIVGAPPLVQRAWRTLRFDLTAGVTLSRSA